MKIIQKLIIVFTIMSGVFVLISAYYFNLLFKKQERLLEVTNEMVSAHEMIDEIRQESYTLTRLARLYVSTKEPIYKSQFNKVLGVINGQVPRHANYDRVYWELILDENDIPPFDVTEKISTKRKLGLINFSQEEERYLKKALDASLALTYFEIEAMNLIEGCYKDSVGLYTISGESNEIKSLAMVNSRYYNLQIKSIMDSLNSSYKLVENRYSVFQVELGKRIKYKTTLILLLFFIIIFCLVVIMFLLLRLKKTTIMELRSEVHQRTKDLKRHVLLLESSALELKKANEEKDMFISIIAHDLKDPFNSLIGFSELLMSKVLQENKNSCFVEIVEIINSVSSRAYNLLLNLLEWAKAQGNSLDFVSVELNVKNELMCVLDVLELAALKKQITINVQVCADLKINGDKHMIKTILRNLISNAIKFSNKKSEIIVKAEKRDNGVVFSIIDYGVGIDDLQMKMLFQSNNIGKMRKAGTDNESGSGLGLSLCKNLIDRHKGEIWVERNMERGLNFSFLIPD